MSGNQGNYGSRSRPSDTEALDDRELAPSAPVPLRVQRWLRWLVFSGWVVPPVLFGAIALFCPSDVLDASPLLSSASLKIHDAVRHVWPRSWPRLDIFTHARSTEFPQVAMLATAFAVLWWVWMTLVTWIASIPLLFRRPFDRMGFDSKQLLTLLLLAPFFAGLGFFAFFGLPGDPSFARELTTGSRAGYAVAGILCVSVSSFAAGLAPIAFILLLFARKGGSDV